MKLKILTLISLLLLLVIAQHSQAQTTKTDTAGDTGTIAVAPNGDGETVCDRRLAQTLDELDASEQLTAKQADIIAKQDKRFIAALEIIKEYATVEKKDRKSFWKKAKEKLAGLIDAVTDPEVIRAIALIIAISKN